MTTRFEDFYYRGLETNAESALSKLEQASCIAVDMETVSTNDLTALGIGIYISPVEGFYFPLFPTRSEHAPLAMWKISHPDVTKIYWNGNGFDLEVLDRFADDEGFAKPDDLNYQDAAYAARASGLTGSLQQGGEEELGMRDLFSIQDLFTEYNAKGMLGVPEERIAEKCLNDCRTTYMMHLLLDARMNNGQRDSYEVDRKLIPVLRRVQKKGLRLRPGLLEQYKRDLERSVFRVKSQCDLEGFNPGSPQQVGYILGSRNNVLPFKRGSKKPTLNTSEEVLESLDDPLAKLVLDYRHDSKLLSTYVLPWLGKDRAYTHLRLDLSTGRLASGKVTDYDELNRNLQNIPPHMRDIFDPDNGIWSWADHGQIELRVLAFIARDTAMMAEYAKAKPDLHQATADTARKYVPNFTRDSGKTFNFARVFGAGDRQLSRKTGVPLKDVPAVRAAMASIFPQSEAWIMYQTRNHGTTVEDIFGRTMRLPEYHETETSNKRAFEMHVAKCAVNYSVQGSAANIMKRGMLLLDKYDFDTRLSVHDEYLCDGDYDFPEELAHIHPELHTPFETKKGVVWT